MQPPHHLWREGAVPIRPLERVNPLTPAQQLIAKQKLAIANKEIAQPGFVSGGAVRPASCPFVVTSANIGVTPMSFCAGYYGSVSTRAVEQQYNNWCGVATVQVVSNYAWATGSANKYTQVQINSNWNHLPSGNGAGTSTSVEITALNGAVGTKLPGGFVYDGVYHSGSLTGPLSGSEWHGYLRTDLSVTYKMPQVVSVSPMDPNLSLGLSTWAAVGAPKQNAGHWIVLYAWDQVWDGTTGPSVSYDDSGILHSGGVQGSDPAYNVYTMIKQYNPQHGTNGVVW
jgi:hypothetical protein